MWFGTARAIRLCVFKAIVTASVSVMLLCLASAASARSSCEETAATNYAIAIAIDYATADMVIEDTMADCEDPMPYAQAIAIAQAEHACYIEQYSGGWIVETECDSE